MISKIVLFKIDLILLAEAQYLSLQCWNQSGRNFSTVALVSSAQTLR